MKRPTNDPTLAAPIASTMGQVSHPELEELYRSADAVRTAGLTALSSEAIYRRYVEFVYGLMPTGRILDVGCGTGWSTHWFAKLGYEAIGVDLNPAAFEPLSHDRLRFAPGSATDLPFSDGSFDVAASNQCLEHVPDPARMLAEMVRVVKPGGVVAIVGPNLLALGPSLAALTRYVWRNRPVWRIFIRRPGMPRHPFGNTLPEAVWATLRNVALTLRKVASSRPTFTMRTPDLQPPFHADNDAVYLCNPLDLVRYFRRAGCTVLRSVGPDRRGWTRMFAGGTWVAARTPV